jgi:hypothetical protein
VYRHEIKIEMPDDIVHKYSIMEWETILLADAIITRDQLPLSYGAIAEIIAVELYKYRLFRGVDDNDWKCQETTSYVNDKGFTTNVKLPSTLFSDCEDPAGTMLVGRTHNRFRRRT